MGEKEEESGEEKSYCPNSKGNMSSKR